MLYESLPVPERPKLRPPIGIPAPVRGAKVRSALASIGVHALIIALLIVPLAAPAIVRRITDGAGGDTPVGGGGGGLRGRGGDLGGAPVVERLRFVQLVPPPTAAPAAPAVPAIKPPIVPPPPVKPPTPAAPPAQTAAPTQAPTAAASSVTAPVAGSGGGTGADGTQGSGPGTGGGVGSGSGAGHGSGAGPGVGGGNTANYAPALIETFLPPSGVSKRDKGKTVVAVFDVDSTGRVVNVEFTQVSDGGYNRKLREAFEAFRFRPAVRPDGTPIRAKTSFEYVL